MLTNAAVKAARPGARPYKLADGRGLHLYVAPNGRRSWRMKCRLQKRELLLTFGQFPQLSLADARAQCEEAREQLRRGRDPRSAGADCLPTFEGIARQWHEHRAQRWSAEHVADVISSLERHVFPAIGAVPMVEIDRPTIMKLLLRVERAGAFETARRLRQRISAVFVFAIARELADQDPAALLVGELGVPPATRRQPALTTIEEARELLEAADRSAAARPIKLASRFLALTAVRLSAVRGATWREIEDLDGPNPLWRIPAARMKLSKAKKASTQFDHLVPLSATAAAVLLEAKNGHDTRSPDELIFAGRSGVAVGEGAIGALYARAGFAGRHVPHGWRATFATILNELVPKERDAIDRALAHSPKDKVEAAYNRAEQLARRRRLFETWAKLLIDRAAG